MRVPDQPQSDSIVCGSPMANTQQQRGVADFSWMVQGKKEFGKAGASACEPALSNNFLGPPGANKTGQCATLGKHGYTFQELVWKNHIALVEFSQNVTNVI